MEEGRSQSSSINNGNTYIDTQMHNMKLNKLEKKTKKLWEEHGQTTHASDHRLSSPSVIGLIHHRTFLLPNNSTLQKIGVPGAHRHHLSCLVPTELSYIEEINRRTKVSNTT